MLNDRSWALVGVGTNTPHNGYEGAALLSQALAELGRRGLTVAGVSNAWGSPAWPPSDQAPYVNAVALIETEGRAPAALLAELLAVEAVFGRVRGKRWAARTLDLDIIDQSGGGQADGVEIPHPRAHERAFVLAPLGEVAPGWRHPLFDRTAAELLADLPDQGARPLGPLPPFLAEPPPAG